MNRLQKQLERWLGLLRIEAKYPKVFFRPNDLSAGKIPAPGTGVADSLTIREKTLAPPQSLLRTIAFNRNSCQVRRHLDEPEVVRVRTSRFAIVHAEGSQDLSFRREYWIRPRGSQPMP